MYLINRAVEVVKLKEPFLDWVNSMSGPKLTLEAINKENHVFLLAEHGNEQELELIIQQLYPDIFRIELRSFCRDESRWPKIKYRTFLDWFDIEVHSTVFDPYDREIEREEFLHY